MKPPIKSEDSIVAEEQRKAQKS